MTAGNTFSGRYLAPKSCPDKCYVAYKRVTYTIIILLPCRMKNVSLKKGNRVKVCRPYFGEQHNIYYRFFLFEVHLLYTAWLRKNNGEFEGVYVNPAQNSSLAKSDDWSNLTDLPFG